MNGRSLRYSFLLTQFISGVFLAERILVVDDEEIIRDSISFILEKEGFSVDQAANGREGLDKLLANSYDLVISDIEMPRMNGIDLLKNAINLSPDLTFIIITAFGSLDTAISALRAGASDYILKPIEFDELTIKINRLLETRKLIAENRLLKKEVQRQFDYDRLIGKSAAMKKMFDMITTVAAHDSTVLITGNSGTGKELIARAIHHNSKRKNKSFVAVNCGAISENLIESELFGHKKGAFTGAVSDKEGFLKAADGGTLFLDEISEMPVLLQVKLLRVIQEREFIQVGTTQPIPINIRFLASTNRNLKEEIEKERFREDLYYRLNVVEIHLPSLRDRLEDIPLLADHFVNKYRTEMGKSIKGFDARALNALIGYQWPGEVRELENTVERAVIFAKDEYITVNELPEPFHQFAEIPQPQTQVSLDDYIKRVEKDYIVSVLESCEFNKDEAAKILNLGLSTLYRKIKDHGLDI